MNYINSVNELRGATFSAMRFVRGYGIINDRFDLSFKCKDGKVILEIETNIRIRDDESVLLAFNDLYLDKSRHEISIRRYRSQTGIEKTYLSKHAYGYVPFLLYDSRGGEASGLSYTEANGLLGPHLENGTALMDLLFQTGAEA